MSDRIAMKQSLFVHRPPDAVWDFSQDYSRRREWDKTIRSAIVLSLDPWRVQVRIAGGTTAVFRYLKLERPAQTIVLMEDVRSPLVSGGGGTWKYEARYGGTWWTQNNSLELKPHWQFLAPIVRWRLERAMRKAMKKAKTLMETEAPAHEGPVSGLPAHAASNQEEGSPWST